MKTVFHTNILVAALRSRTGASIALLRTLRLLASLKAEAEKVAAAEGTTLNQFINVAVAEKLAALRTAQYFQERAARADLDAFDRLLANAGEKPPRPGDEPV